MTPSNVEFAIDSTALSSPSSSRKTLSHEESASSNDSISVMFSPRKEVFEYEADFDRSGDSWLSKDEIEGFRRDCRRTLKVSMAGKIKAFPDLCDRGLEHMSTAGSIQASSRRKFSKSIVLDEQGRQRDTKEHNPEKLSEAYQKSASRSKMMALAMAQGDARSVQA